MLTRLRIRNFAIVDELEFDAAPGLTVFTGETGAGKTVIVEAIRFLLGGRVVSEMVRTGAREAVVEAEFDAIDSAVAATLSLPTGSLWLRRELAQSGTTRAFVGERQLRQTELRALGESLADLCGQHQQQLLLDSDRHAELLDRFGGCVELSSSVADVHAELSDARRRLTEATAAWESECSREELRRFQIDEIRAAAIVADEEERLVSERSILRHGHRLIEGAERALSALSETDGSVSDIIARLVRDAGRLAELDERWSKIAEQLNAAQEAVADSTRSLADYRQSLEFDPGQLDRIESRLALLHRLKSKYGATGAAILARLDELQTEEQSAGDLEVRVRKLSDAVGQLQGQLTALASELSAQRRHAAPTLEKKVDALLSTLGMSGARIQVEMTPTAIDGTDAIGPNGAERIRFLFEANPAEGFKPLDKIASGGELSRLLLAFKTITGGPHDNRLYVFDEIDSGIGGETAHKVASRIADLSKHAQVFLVSHLQQMAAPADSHVQISKQTVRGRSKVRLRLLRGEERIGELARMVAGDRITERTLEYAAELTDGRKRRR